jgi:hypothetical protein
MPRVTTTVTIIRKITRISVTAIATQNNATAIGVVSIPIGITIRIGGITERTGIRGITTTGITVTGNIMTGMAIGITTRTSIIMTGIMRIITLTKKVIQITAHLSIFRIPRLRATRKIPGNNITVRRPTWAATDILKRTTAITHTSTEVARI